MITHPLKYAPETALDPLKALQWDRAVVERPPVGVYNQYTGQMTSLDSLDRNGCLELLSDGWGVFDEARPVTTCSLIPCCGIAILHFGLRMGVAGHFVIPSFSGLSFSKFADHAAAIFDPKDAIVVVGGMAGEHFDVQEHSWGTQMQINAERQFVIDAMEERGFIVRPENRFWNQDLSSTVLTFHLGEGWWEAKKVNDISHTEVVVGGR